jgi:hypothetical protein
MPDHLSNDAGGQADHHMRDELPAYATAIAIGDAPAALYPAVAAHLAACAECQNTLDELLELLEPAYAGRLEPAARYPAANLAFLEVPMQLSQPAAPVWLLDAGRLMIRFSDALLAAIRQQPLAGAARSARGQLIFRYTQEPGSVNDLDISIEVYAEDTAQRQGRVRVGVDVPSRGPLDQTGSLVTLHLGDTDLHGQTDESGCVDFAPVPLDALPSLRVEITPRSL